MLTPHHTNTNTKVPSVDNHSSATVLSFSGYGTVFSLKKKQNHPDVWSQIRADQWGKSHRCSYGPGKGAPNTSAVATPTPWDSNNQTALAKGKCVTKLFKTYIKFTQWTAKHNGCTIWANNQGKTRSQHDFKAHHMKTLLHCKSQTSHFQTPFAYDRKHFKQLNRKPQKQPLKPPMENPVHIHNTAHLYVMGSPLAFDYQCINLCRKHLFRSALGALWQNNSQTSQTSPKPRPTPPDCLQKQALLMGALIFIKHRVFFIHYSELQQSAGLSLNQGYLALAPFQIQKQTAYLCNLVRSRLNFQLKALLKKTPLFKKTAVLFSYWLLCTLSTKQTPQTDLNTVPQPATEPL
jgi:hypothetical protein